MMMWAMHHWDPGECSQLIYHLYTVNNDGWVVKGMKNEHTKDVNHLNKQRRPLQRGWVVRRD